MGSRQSENISLREWKRDIQYERVLGGGEDTEIIIKNYGEIEDREKARRMALGAAALGGYTKIIRLVLDHDTDVNTMLPVGTYALHHAIS